jgi:putative ABC transport system substrate-binding protein
MGKFRKFAASVLAMAITLSFAACNSGTSSNSSSTVPSNSGGNSSTASSTGEKKQIGIIQLMDHPALNAAHDGFVAALEEKGYKDGENITIVYQNGQGDTNNLSTIADKFVGDKVDLVLAIATPAAQAVAGKTKDIPIIATAVTDFAEAGLVESNEKPNTNVSGTNDMNPIEAQFDLMFQLCPEVKTVGFLYNSSEDNSRLQVEIAKALLDTKGIQYVERTVASTNDVQQATTSIVTECDAVYLPTDNVFASSMPIVSAITTENKIPVICGESNMVDNGGLATLGINYYNIGHQAGLMALRILEEGAAVADMPVESSTDYDFCINGPVAEAIGITIPDDLKQYIITPAAS